MCIKSMPDDNVHLCWSLLTDHYVTKRYHLNSGLARWSQEKEHVKSSHDWSGHGVYMGLTVVSKTARITEDLARNESERVACPPPEPKR